MRSPPSYLRWAGQRVFFRRRVSWQRGSRRARARARLAPPDRVSVIIDWTGWAPSGQRGIKVGRLPLPRPNRNAAKAPGARPGFGLPSREQAYWVDATGGAGGGAGFSGAFLGVGRERRGR